MGQNVGAMGGSGLSRGGFRCTVAVVHKRRRASRSSYAGCCACDNGRRVGFVDEDRAWSSVSLMDNRSLRVKITVVSLVGYYASKAKIVTCVDDFGITRTRKTFSHQSETDYGHLRVHLVSSPKLPELYGLVCLRLRELRVFVFHAPLKSLTLQANSGSMIRQKEEENKNKFVPGA